MTKIEDQTEEDFNETLTEKALESEDFPTFFASMLKEYSDE